MSKPISSRQCANYKGDGEGAPIQQCVRRQRHYGRCRFTGDPDAVGFGSWMRIRIPTVFLRKGAMDQGIGWAVKQMDNGSRVRRRGWNRGEMYLELQKPDAYSKMTHPYVFINTGAGVIPWNCSQADLLGMDWEVCGADSQVGRGPAIQPSSSSA